MLEYHRDSKEKQAAANARRKSKYCQVPYDRRNTSVVVIFACWDSTILVGVPKSSVSKFIKIQKQKKVGLHGSKAESYFLFKSLIDLRSLSSGN